MSDHPVQLLCHPAHPAAFVDSLTVQAMRQGDGLQLRFELTGNLAQLRIPAGGRSGRRDALWKHTCFEAFLRIEGADNYVEFNVAPNGDWAAYQFTDYRQNGSDLDCAAPQVDATIDGDGLSVSVLLKALPPELQTNPTQLGLTAVLEEKDGHLSYWALHHPSNKPDFHHTETFKINLD